MHVIIYYSISQNFQNDHIDQYPKQHRRNRSIATAATPNNHNHQPSNKHEPDPPTKPTSENKAKRRVCIPETPLFVLVRINHSRVHFTGYGAAPCGARRGCPWPFRGPLCPRLRVSWHKGTYNPYLHSKRGHNTGPRQSDKPIAVVIYRGGGHLGHDDTSAFHRDPLLDVCLSELFVVAVLGIWGTSFLCWVGKGNVLVHLRNRCSFMADT